MGKVKVGDVCQYPCGSKNKSNCTVEVLRILDDYPDAAEVKFLAVREDDSGNGLFSYLLKTGKTMNVSIKYLTKKETM